MMYPCYFPNHPYTNRIHVPSSDPDLIFHEDQWTPNSIYQPFLTTVKPTDKYYYVLDLRNYPTRREFFSNNSSYPIWIPESVRDDVTRGQAKLVIDYCHEGHEVHWNWPVVFRRMGVSDPSSCIFLYSDALSGESRHIPTVYFCYWEWWQATHKADDATSHILSFITDMGNKVKRPFVGLSMNRRLRPQRIDLCRWIDKTGLGKYIDYSFGRGFMELSRNDTTPTNTHMLDDLRDALSATNTPITDDVLEWLQRHGSKNLSTEPGLDLRMNQLNIGDRTAQAFRNSYVSIITETCTNNAEGTLFLSEKSFKPMRMLHPFIIWGQQGTIQHLRDLGYDVFDDVFDHSYDLPMSDDQRKIKFFAEISRIVSIPTTTWSVTTIDIFPRLMANYHMLTRAKHKLLDLSKPVYRGKTLE